MLESGLNAGADIIIITVGGDSGILLCVSKGSGAWPRCLPCV